MVQEIAEHGRSGTPEAQARANRKTLACASASHHMRHVWTLALVALALLQPGCALINKQSTAAAPVSSQGVTFVADGSGDLRQVADALAAIAKENHTGMEVERVKWSHGKGAVFPDLYDNEHHQANGQALANQMVAYRKTHPDSRICLIGYSSGASVALAAAERLPPATINRIILLSPTVSAKHDLRPALRSSLEGIDAFNSEWDVISTVLYAMGTGDGVGQAVAGRGGFVPVGDNKEDEQLYKGLRQHFWKGPQQWSGHDGGHFGCMNREFLRAQVLPRVMGRE
jgi:pimeloyl-ACP methyl ester carboxylesterase